jgi:radical SAM superfamily enzyme YgiQ (UPF0313 family)
MTIAVAFYRTLASQSSASLTAGYLTAHLRQAGHSVHLVQLDVGDGTDDAQPVLDASADLVFYKLNFKDLGRLPANLAALAGASICFFGPFAVLNAAALLDDYPQVRGVLLPNHEPAAADGVPWLLGRTDAPPIGFLVREGSHLRSSAAEPDRLAASLWKVWPARDVELGEPIRLVNLEATRGCLRGCTFCHVPPTTVYGGARVLRRDPADVLREMAELWALGKRYFIFNDSIFGGGGSEGVRWLGEFADRLIHAGKAFYFYAYFTLADLEAQPVLMRRLAEAGLVRVFVGIESSSETSTRRLRKGVRVRSFPTVKADLKRIGVVPHIGFMLFHPFATPAEILDGIDFLYETDELHRFGVILEATRLIPGTVLLEQAEQADLVTSRDYRVLRHAYRFASDDTARLYDRFQACFTEIGVPLLERFEHLFVTGEFIDNLVRRLTRPSEAYEQRARDLGELRQRYSDDFRALCFTLAERGDAAPDASARYRELWQTVERSWRELMDAAEEAGLDEPLAWIPTGVLRPESSRGSDYDGRRMTTRSGLIEV